MKSLFVKLRKLDYRHYILTVITLGLFALYFAFPNAPGRFIESVRDFGLSMAYYFCEIFEIPHEITPTVAELSAYKATSFLPFTYDEFKVLWSEYWRVFATWENVSGYFSSIGQFLYDFSRILIIVLPFFVLLYVAFIMYLSKQNNDYNVESNPLKAYKSFVAHTFTPVKAWIIGFVQFIKEHKAYWIIWLVTLLLHFNGITIVIEFFAFYFYFVASFNFLDLYLQVVKLLIDLAPLLTFFPVEIWIIVTIIVLWKLSLNRGYAVLSHRERMNRGFANERGVVNNITGYVGAGKTTLETDMGLSYDVQMLDDSLEIILETDMKFPNFPWINLELELRRACYYHVVFDIWSVRRWVALKYERWQKAPCRDKIFDYDYERYGLTYDNNLTLVDVWSAIRDYSSAYFIYTIQSSYIISNYSVRTDRLVSDIGNFPIWNTDFFKRDSRLIDSFSRHSHILDFDMLRLGKKMLEDNPNRNAFGFGVYLVSEIDKERKNAPELQEVKRNTDECNQKNDLFNTCIKMSRHACVVANRVFVHVLGDLQRMGSLNSDLGELGDSIEVYSKGDMFPVLPFWSPFWWLDTLGGIILNKFNDFYLQYRYNRSDNTLLLYLYKNISAKFFSLRDKINNLFGSQVLELHVERGTKDGDIKSHKWFRQSKKIYSGRFATDCMSAIFESRGEVNTVGIEDLAEYADIMAKQDELDKQHSHFQSDVNKILENSF